VTWPVRLTPTAPPKVGRRPSTTHDDISRVAIELFAAHGFDAVSVDDVARAAGISRRSLFRYYSSKNAILWGDFETHLGYLGQLLDAVGPQVPLRTALRDALLAFNTFDESEATHHRQRMRVILETAELQAYSMTMYAGWRDVIARYVATRFGVKAGDLVPQTTAWTLLGVALSAYEPWVAEESSTLAEALVAAFDVVGPAFDTLPI
jgi:TetR/AcrR family transcriptional regulator, regulator of mycofactocin system